MKRKATRRFVFLTIILTLFSITTALAQNKSQKLVLDGDLDYATTADANSLDITGKAITVEAWIKHDGNSDENAFILNKTEPDAMGYDLQLVGSGEEVPVKFRFGNFGGSITSNTGIPANRWTHIAATYNGNNLTLYINGELDKQISEDGKISDSATDLYLGTNSTANGNFFSGEIDGVRIWSVNRSFADIRLNMYKELNGNETGLVAYYPFPDFNPVTDVSGSHDLSLVGDAKTELKDALPVPPDIYTSNEGNGSVTLTWDQRGGSDNAADSLTLYQSTPTGPSGRYVIDELSGSEFKYTSESLSNGKTFFWEITANRNLAEGESEQGDLSSFVTGTPYENLGGYSLKLDGDLDYAEVSDRPSISLKGQTGDSITVETWIKHDGNSDENAFILNKTEPDAMGYDLSLVGSGEEVPVKFRFGNFGGSITTETGIKADRWTHIAATYDGTNLSIYVNGELDNQKSEDGSISNGDTDLVIGSSHARNERFYSGRIDEVAIWGTARSKSEIQESYKEELTGNERKLKAYWRFNDARKGVMKNRSTGHTYRHADAYLAGDAELSAPGIFPLPPAIYAKAYSDSVSLKWYARYDNLSDDDEFTVYRSEDRDESTRSSLTTVGSAVSSYQDNTVLNNTNYLYEATYTNAVGQESDYAHPAPVTPSMNRFGNALFLDGDKDYGKVTDRPSLSENGQSISVEAWINRDGNSDPDAYIINKTEPDAMGYDLQLIGSGEEVPVKFRFGNFGGGITSNAMIPVNSWVHVAATYDGNTLSLYINGELDKEKTEDGVISDGDTGFMFGTTNAANENFYSGMVDEVRLWRDVRTKDEISNNYNKELMGDEEGLIAYWRFNESAGTTPLLAASERPKTLMLFGDTYLTPHNFSDNPPMFSTETDTITVKTDTSRTFDYSATAPAHGAQIEDYGLNQNPDFVSIDTTNGELAVNPSDEDVGTYDFDIIATDTDDRQTTFDITLVVEMTTSNESEGALPQEYSLKHNYPNPFNPSTVINYELPQNSEVQLEVFDISGRKVRTLVDEQQPAGEHQVRFNASSLSSGVYFYRIDAGSFQKVRKMTLIK